ncbi:MAG TPA: histidinol dehydrogenase, partial [Candidatus Desulfofervidus auxilii]|nr:histidinol dehydrogenase [Candidatus Desulfofervidus auxilii]
LIENPFSLLTKIKHAGAIFLGEYAVEAIGDYMAGPNHTLPTGGTARFSSVLSTEHFLKRSSILLISKEGTKALGPKVIALAHLEGLMAHALSVEERLKENRE